MTYSAEISSDNPSCFLFLIDQSTSMAEEVSAGEATVPKAVGVADTMNRWRAELSIKCAKSAGISPRSTSLTLNCRDLNES